MEANLREAMEKASSSLEPRALGVLCRKPLLDEDCPEASDVDLLPIWDGPEERPERLVITGSSGRVFVDLLWIPISVMEDPVQAASYRILPHLLLESETIWLRSDWTRSIVDQIKINAHDRAAWERRLSGHIHFGDAAFQEAQRNLDFPPVALFFLQTAHAYYMMALADCLKRTIMSLQTKPMMKLRRMADETGCRFVEMLTTDLHLGIEPSAQLKALRRIYDVVGARCPRQPVPGMNLRTGGHYSYSISPLELEYREMVAESMIRRGHHENALFYIRFWAYSLARCPIVLEEARRGRNPSFYVPYEPLRGALQAMCPEIIEDLALILGGEVTRAEAEISIKGTSDFKFSVVEEIRKRGFNP